MRLHRQFTQVLADPSSWAGFAGILTSLGLQLEPPYSFACHCLAAFASIIAIIISQPPGK